MADDATPVWIAKEGRFRYYRRQDTTRPGQQERRRMRVIGMKWCRGCREWLPVSKMTNNGVCRFHAAAEYRAHYASNPRPIQARVQARKRGLAPLSPDGAEAIAELFEGLCAYCECAATSWDHLHPVAGGGKTEPGNIVPACASCNSSKKDRDVFDWMLVRGVRHKPALVEALALAAMGPL